MDEDLFDAALDQALLAVINDVEDDDEDNNNGLERVFVDLEGFRRLEGRSFSRHFRMERAVFQRLIFEVGNHLTRTGRLDRIIAPLDVTLLFTVWVLANPDTFRSSGSQFGVADSTVHMHYSSNVMALREMASDYIKWPTEAERDTIKANFEMQYGYPGVIGCIDGTHINISAPLEQPQRYVNRHHRYSILVQAVCDHRLLYRDVYVGQPGSVGDARMYQRSPLSMNLLTRPDLIADDEHLVGDGAYVLTKNVMIPYVDDGNLNAMQRHHNLELSQVRSSIERGYCLSKGKFRRLKYLPNYNFEIALDHIMASFVLHNFVILEGIKIQGDRGGEHIHVHAQPGQELLNAARNEGVFKREYIARQLFLNR